MWSSPTRFSETPRPRTSACACPADRLNRSAPESPVAWKETTVRVRGGAMKGLVVLVVVVLIGVIGLLGAITGRGMAQTSGSIRVPGLHAPATVGRDEHGIIQIVADDPHDLFLAQGYAHAQERMWQMEVWRHIGSGRLSELFGAVSLGQDGAANRDRRPGRVHPGAMDGPRFRGLGEGPVVQSRRQHGLGDLPAPGGRAAGRSGADGFALSRVQPRRARDHPVRA